MLTDFVGCLANALVVAPHAGDTVGHRAVELTVVEHDFRRSLVETFAGGFVQVVRLEAVRQAEDGFATVMLEGVGAIRAERVHEQALLRSVSLEIVGGPEIPGRDAVPLDQPVVLGDTGMLEAGTLDEKLLDIALDIQILLLLELDESRRQLEQIEIERRPRCGEGEPISAHPSERGVGERGDRLIHRRIQLQGVRITA